LNKPGKVFDWRKRRSWLASIRHYAAEVLSEEVHKHVRRARPQCWSDDMSWLPDNRWLVGEFCGRMTEYYTHFRAFHGCRPVRTAAYYEHGLLGQSKGQIHATFRELFGDHYAADALDCAIEQFEQRGLRESGKIWFLACDEELVQRCGHYLIQGSEYLMALAGTLGGTFAQRRLRGLGVPTVFEVDIPTSFLSGAQQQEVARSILSEWGQLVARRPLGMSGTPPCYVLRQDLPPQYIRGDPIAQTRMSTCAGAAP
jgi:hypothetical protein